MLWSVLTWQELDTSCKVAQVQVLKMSVVVVQFGKEMAVKKALLPKKSRSIGLSKNADLQEDWFETLDKNYALGFLSD